MAKVTFNPCISSIHGRIGDIVFKKVNGRTFATPLPLRGKDPQTPGQRAVRERFAEAAAYARTALGEPASLAYYQAVAARRGIPVHAAATSDFLKSPVIAHIRVIPGNRRRPLRIRVVATDDAAVVGVWVTIRQPDGTFVQAGTARADGGDWFYEGKTATQRGSPFTVEVIASDRAGNATTRLFEHGTPRSPS